jgi:hypothetical protein
MGTECAKIVIYTYCAICGSHARECDSNVIEHVLTIVTAPPILKSLPIYQTAPHHILLIYIVFL